MTVAEQLADVARVVAGMADAALNRAVPMDPVTQAEIDDARRWADRQAATNTPAADAELMHSAAMVLTAMAPHLPEYTAVAGALIPALNTRAESLRQQANPNVAAALELFPQHSR